MSSAGKKRLLLVMAAMLAVSLAGCGRSTVAKVNGRKISRREYYNRLERMPVAQQNQQQQVEAGLLAVGNLISDELWLQLAEKENVAPTEAQVDERYKQMQRTPAVMAQMKRFGVTKEEAKKLLQVPQAQFNLLTRGVKVPNKEVKEFYEENKKTQFTVPKNAEVMALVCEDKSSLDKAMGLLEKGVQFDIVAQQFLPKSESNAADGRPRTGTFVYGDRNVPEEIQKAVFSTKKDEHTKPLEQRNPEGEVTEYVVFKVLRHRKERIQKYSEVRYAIREAMMQEKGRKKRDIIGEFNKFHEKANLKVNIARYSEQLVPKPAEEEGKKEEEKQEKPKK